MPVARKPKGQYHHGDLRRALLDAALSLLKKGQDVGLRDVARRAGVSHTAPYRHFADKEALLAAVAEEGFLALSKALRASTASAREPLERYYAGTSAYVRFAVRHPAHYRVMFGVRSALKPEELLPSVAAAGQDAFGILLALIVEMQGAGLLRAGEPREIAVALWSMEHGLAMLELDGLVAILPGTGDEERSRLVHRMLLEGLAPAKK